MFEAVAYLICAWCYSASLVLVMWVVPNILSRYGILVQIGVYLFAVSLLIRGNEAWQVAEGSPAAEYWAFRNAITPIGATCIIIGELIRHGKRRRSKKASLRRSQASSCTASCSVQHLSHLDRAGSEVQ